MKNSVKKVKARMRELEVKCINVGVTHAEQREFLALEKILKNSRKA
jgi:hypothetical protein